MATAKTTLQTIVAHHYVATAAQVEVLAHERYTGNTVVLQSDETYLRILLAGVQGRLGRSRGRAPGIQTQLQVLETINKPFYEAVLRGVTTEDVAPDETVDDEERAKRTRLRNSRSGFARSSKSTLKTFVEAGGDLRTLEVVSTTKRKIREAFKPPEPVDRVQRQIQRAEESLMRALARQAKTSPQTAQATAEAFVEALQEAVAELEPTTPQRPVEAPAQRTRVGAVTFRPQA